MSRPAGHPALRAALSEEIAALLLDHSAREVGRWIGRKGDTVTERGAEVDAWPLSELLVLAERGEGVRVALRAYMTSEKPQPRGEAIAAPGGLLREMAASGDFISLATRALGNGRVDTDEATELLMELQRRREDEDRVLIPALTACIKEG